MFFDTTSEVVAGGEALTVTRLEALMRLFHRRYNALAIEPDAVSEGWTVRSEPSRVLLAHSAPLPSGDAVLASAAPLADANTPSVLLVLLLFGAVNVLVRRGVAPMFLLDIDPEPDSGEAAAGRPTVTNTLFVGVPGATELADRADGAVVHVYDVRTLATERLRGVTPVERPDPLRSPMTVGAIAGAIAPDWKLHVRQHRRSNWADAFEYGELPGRGGLVGFSHVDHRFDEAEFRGQTLALLEQVVYRHGCAVWLAAYRDPLERLADNDATAAERERWTQVLSSFSRRLVPTGMTHRQSDDAEPFYGAVWNACSTDEKVALRQIADEDVINPRNGRVVRDLVSKGLVRREGTFHVASGRLRQFILETSSARQTAEWEREGVTVPWATLSTTLAAVAFGLGGLLVFTQQQLFDAWVGFMPSLAPVLPTIVRWLAGANGGSKAGAAE